LEVVVKIPSWLEKPAVLVLLLYRRIRYGYAFRRIKLTQNKYAIVDAEDYERLSKYKWYANGAKGHLYAARRTRKQEGTRYRFIYMHQEVIKVAAGEVCDHINHNGLDNRKANLRPASRAENVFHRKKYSKTSRSKYKGITWKNTSKKWQAQIGVNGKKIFLGYFRDEFEAAKAYDKAARKYHGEFAALNFPNFTAE
jgi:hypothetical protein